MARAITLRNLTILAAIIGLAVGVSLGLATPAHAEKGGHVPVTFCHNVTHNPHEITTDKEGLINGHMKHVASGMDTLGPCPVTPDPVVTPPVEEPDPVVTPPVEEPDPVVTPPVEAPPAAPVVQDPTFTG